jgi:glycosyltransferase involved in cell wall biosynthesis
VPSPDTAAVAVGAPTPRREHAARVTVRLVADVDAAGWAADHARGLRPDASPYGLDRLGTHGFAVREGRLPEPASRLTARLDRMARHRGGGLEWWSGLRAGRPADTDVVLCWDERTGLPALARHGDVPVATGVIWLPETWSRWHGAARHLLARAAAVWALSPAQLPELRDQWGVAASRLHHLPFGIDEQFWSPLPRDSDAPAVVLGVGNDRHRDHDLLVRAVAGLPARLSLVTALPVTVPPEVGERLTAVNHAELRQRYAEADVVAVLLQPNRHVSGVTSVLEAQAMGRPVVVTDTPGMRDYVRPGLTAVLVPPGDADAARDAIAGLLADSDRADAMGRAGREFVVEHATSAAMVERLAGILEQV